MLLHATNVEGVVDDNGHVIPLITKDNFEAISKHFKQKENDVTGAMKGKVGELLLLDTPSFVLNGLKPERIKDAMLGKEVMGTKIGR
jgi:isopentenyl phosphate kinase